MGYYSDLNLRRAELAGEDAAEVAFRRGRPFARVTADPPIPGRCRVCGQPGRWQGCERGFCCDAGPCGKSLDRAHVERFERLMAEHNARLAQMGSR
jgi:hypothetical protein